MIGKDRGAFLALCGIAQLSLEIVTVKNIIAQHQSRRVVADKVAADDEGLRQPIRRRLHRVAQIQPPRAAIAQQLLEARRILRCRDNQDVAYPRQHQGGERIVNHRLVVHRQELLGNRQCHRMQSRTGAARENDAFTLSHFDHQTLVNRALKQSSIGYHSGKSPAR